MIRDVWRLLMQPETADCLYPGEDDVPSRGSSKYGQAVIDMLSESIECASVSALADFILRHTEEQAQVCLVFENRHSIRFFMKRRRFGRGPAYSVSEVRRALKEKGFKSVNIYPLLPRGRNLFEIVLPVGGSIFPLSLQVVKRIFQRAPFWRIMHPAFAVIAGRDRMPGSSLKALLKACGIERIERCIMGRPLSLIIISGKRVLRIPLNRLTAARNRTNHHILEQLSGTGISPKVPQPLSKGRVCGYRYFCESRLKGYAYDSPVPEMDTMVRTAARFLAHFQKSTCKRVKIDEYWSRRLFEQPFNKLACYVDTPYALLLGQLKDRIRDKVFGDVLETVWCHGDYKVENILFDKKKHEIVGIIDWDLSRRQGLPLLDIFYLLIYRAGICSRSDINNLIKDHYLVKGFSPAEQAVIDDYLSIMGGCGFRQDLMLVMFWMDHILRRYRQQLESRRELENNWLVRYVYPVLEAIDRITGGIYELKS